MNWQKLKRETVGHDVKASLVLFLVTLPLCLGIALASNAPLVSGIISGIVGGIVVGVLSHSHSSISGPAFGLTVIVAAQITHFGSFEAFLLVVIIAGLIQVAIGLCRAGFIAMFIPTIVVKGFLTAIGVILILNQLPHLLGNDTNPEGKVSFVQTESQKLFAELLILFEGQWHLGAAMIGLLSIMLLILWEQISFLKRSSIPAPLIVVLLGTALSQFFERLGGDWSIQTSHLVQVPIANGLQGFQQFLVFPDFSLWSNPQIYMGALLIAMVSSLETLFSLEAADRIDPQQRQSPPNRELFAQGIGNIVAGMFGGLPVASTIVRSSVNINAGGQTKLSTILYGFLLFICFLLVPQILNLIPLSCLAGILLITGFKLASPTLIKKTYHEGPYQFAPYIITVMAIVFIDVVIGLIVGIVISIIFILYNNMKRPLSRIWEKHIGGKVMKIELANQVCFLNRAVIKQALQEIPRGSFALIDGRNTFYIDPDVLSMLREFESTTAPARGINLSLRGFSEKYQLNYQLKNEIQYVDYSARDLQEQLTPQKVLSLLREGNERFRTGSILRRDLKQQLNTTINTHPPLVVVLSCIDPRASVELIFDLDLGDAFSVRISGNAITPEVLASLEYGCVIEGAPLLVIMGHTRCGAISATIDSICSNSPANNNCDCAHLKQVVDKIAQSLNPGYCHASQISSDRDRYEFVDAVSHQNVLLSVETVLRSSKAIRERVHSGNLAIVGAMYDTTTGCINFLEEYRRINGSPRNNSKSRFQR